MAQLLISRELYSETPHEAHVAAHHQAVTWDESQALGLTQDYYPTVDMECADLYIGGEANMLEAFDVFIFFHNQHDARNKEWLASQHAFQ